MPICYVNPDGTHVQGCDIHCGEHPYQWCADRRAERRQRIIELTDEIAKLREIQEREGDYY